MVRGLAPLWYDEYLPLLRSAVQTADEVCSTRRVNNTFVDVHQADIVDDFHSNLDINKVEQDLRLPDHIYNQFGLEDQKTVEWFL